MSSSKRQLVATLLVAISLATACRQTTSSSDEHVLRYPLWTDITTLDPAQVGGGATLSLLSPIYEPLTTYDSAGRVVPALAASWESSSDRKKYTLRLRPNVRFRDGSALTANDVVYSWTRLLKPATRAAGIPIFLQRVVGSDSVVAGKASSLDGLAAIDSLTLTIRLTVADVIVPQELTSLQLAVLSRSAVEANNGLVDQHSAIGTGPFLLYEVKFGSHATLRAFAGYWRGKPQLDRIDRRVLVDGDALVNSFERGDVDVAQATGALEGSRTNKV